MKRILLLVLFWAVPLQAQSLYVADGSFGVEAGGGRSFGPSSHGFETAFGVSLGGRFDVGLAYNKYFYDVGDDAESSFTELAPFVRYFPIKQIGGKPLTLAASTQLFLPDYGGDDEGRYVQVGVTAYRSVKVTDRFAIQPFGGFAFVAEKYTFGGVTEYDRYLTRDLGIHFMTAPEKPWMLRLTFIEQSFLTETYRAARAAFIRRL